MLRNTEMSKSYQLPIGHKLGGHYEVVQVLGEDDFEILYLVKDLHLGESFVVLKELFLTSYASRNEHYDVEVMAKSKQVFEQTKKDVISEIDLLKAKDTSDAPRVYGYFEAHNTIYTIMEFVNSSDLSAYLVANSQAQSVENVVEKEEPHPKVISSSVEEKQEVKKEKPKSTIFLKILIVSLIIFLGLAYYAYDMIQKDKERAKAKPAEVVVTTEPIKHPPLEDKTKEKEDENLSTLVEEEIDENKIQPEGASYIEEGELPVIPTPTPLPEPVVPEVVEDISLLPDAKIYTEEETEASNDLEERTHTEVEPPVIYEPNIVEAPLPRREPSNISLGTRIN